MPVQSVGNGKRWGKHGKVYRGKGAAAKAARQGRAIHARQNAESGDGAAAATADPSAFSEVNTFKPANTLTPAARPKKRVLKRVTESTWESLDASSVEDRVDEEKGIIYDVAILGPESWKMRDDGTRFLSKVYSEESRRDAVPLYDGVMVDEDHTPPGVKNFSTPCGDRLGVLRKPRFVNGKIRADYHYNRLKPRNLELVEAARRQDLNCTLGFSQESLNDTDYSGDVPVVKKIVTVRKVALVANPATNETIFESADHGGEGMRAMSTDGTDASMGVETDTAVMDPNANASEGGAFDHTMDEICQAAAAGQLSKKEFLDKCGKAYDLHCDEPEEAEEEECESSAIVRLQTAKIRNSPERIAALGVKQTATARETKCAAWAQEDAAATTQTATTTATAMTYESATVLLAEKEIPITPERARLLVAAGENTAVRDALIQGWKPPVGARARTGATTQRQTASEGASELSPEDAAKACAKAF